MGPDPSRALLGDGTEIPRAQAAPSTRGDAGRGRAAASAIEIQGGGVGSGSSSRPRSPCATLPLCPPHGVTRGSPPGAELSPDATHGLAGVAQQTPALSAWDVLDGTGTRASPSGGQGGLPPGTHAKGQGGAARGGTAGVHAVRTQLGHRGEGRPVPSVPDVEGDLSGDRRPAVSGCTRPAPRACGVWHVRQGVRSKRVRLSSSAGFLTHRSRNSTWTRLTLSTTDD